MRFGRSLRSLFGRGGLRPAFGRRGLRPAVRPLAALAVREGGAGFAAPADSAAAVGFAAPAESTAAAAPGWTAAPSAPVGARAGLRPGFTIIELLAVVVIVGILAAVAVPSYQKVANRARAASILGDFRAVRTAVYQYQADHGAWPPDDYRGQLPDALRPYIDGVEFRGEDYLLDYENWGDLIGISVLTDNNGLETALVETVGSEEALSFRLGNRYTFLIESKSP